MTYKIDRLYINNEVKDDPLTARLKRVYSNASVIVGDETELKQACAKLTFHDGKKSILLTRSKGKVLKACPGMEEPYLCCRLQVASPISNCPMYCSYCFLQSYLNNPVTTVYTNLEVLRDEFMNLSLAEPKRLFRITTGELSDSLALDKETNFASRLIEYVNNLSNAVLELKTKTDFIEHLLNLNHCSRIVLSWSLNTRRIASGEEYLSASIEDRVKAAQQGAAAGYLLGFHFDPVVWYPSWEVEYEDIVKFLFSRIPSKQVAWVSIGALRFAPGMVDEMKRFFPKSKLAYGEFIKAYDGKMRYIKPVRFKLYRKMVELIRRYGGDELFVYLCMERADAWEEVMGMVPESPAHLDYLFAARLHALRSNIFQEPPLRAYFPSA